jgi:hypothetical protein
MKLVCLLCGFTALVVARVGVSPVVLSHQAAGPSANQLAAESYSDTADGLHRMLSDLLQTAKNDDQSKLRSQIAELAIPDYKNWFPRTFGPENGAKLESMYEKSLPTSELQFVMLCTELAKQEGEILVEKVTQQKDMARSLARWTSTRPTGRRRTTRTGRIVSPLGSSILRMESFG